MTVDRQPDALPTPDYDSADPTTWAPELDALSAAPDNHRVVFENDRVRVLEVTQEPHSVEPAHHHRWPSLVCLLEGEHLVDHDGVSGEVLLDTRDGLGPLTALSAVWKGPEALHYVENPTATLIRLLRVELKD